MANRLHTISLENIFAVGAECDNFEITWQKDLSCGHYTCEINNDTKVVEVIMPEDCDECIEVIIECADECTYCEPVKIEICPCSGPEDCDDCSECIDNICVSSCEPNEFCEDNQCKECNDEIPCPEGRICVGGKCVCPPGFFETSKGECWPCDPNNVPNCYICTRDGLIPVDCGDKICDPETGNCEECIGTGDCGPNEECEDGDCVCKEGFVRNPVTGNCEPEPECEKDSDCSDCEDCNRYGDCVPKECPDGFVCVDDDCKKPCEDGTDCPDGYGCNPDTGFCEECDEQDCTTPECDKLLGCKCNNSGDCVDVGGCNDTPCNNLFECPDGCVCVQGICVKCENFDCDNCDIPGCECDNNGNCVYDDDHGCEDEVKIVKIADTCDLRGEATIKDGCFCDPITLTFKTTNYRGDDGNRIRLDFVVEARKGLATNFSQSQGLPRLDATGNTQITDNDVPDTGSVSFKQDITVVKLDINGNRIPNTTDVINIFNLGLSFNGLAVVTETNKPVYKVGETYQNSEGTFEITRVKLSVVQNDAFDFTSGSGCVYSTSNIIGNMRVSNSDITKLKDSNFTPLQNFTSITSGDQRNPIFTWFRNDPEDSSYDVNSDVIRQIYKTASSLGVYTDTLFGPDAISNDANLSGSEGELWSLYGYALEVDCACGDNYDDYGKAKFCQPDEVIADFNDCNTVININGFTVCDVNRDRNLYTGVPSNAQVFFDLYLNGSLYRTYQHDQGKIQSATGGELTQPITFSETIKSAKLVQRTSTGIICENVITVPDIPERDVDIFDIDCNADDKFVVSIPKDQDPVDIDYILGWGDPEAGIFKRSFVKSFEEVSFTVFFQDGCTKLVTVTPGCCDQRDINISVIGGEGGSSASVYIVASNMQLPVNYTIIPPSGSSITGTITSPTFIGQVEISNPMEGVYTITAQDSDDCATSVTRTFNIAVSDPPGMDISGCEDYFTGETKNLGIQTNPEAVGGVLNYTKTDLSSPSLTTTNKNLSINSTSLQITVTGSTTFDFISIEKDGNTYPVNKNCTINELDAPVVTSLEVEESGICLGSSATINIEATANSVVTVSGGVGEVQIGGDGNGSFTHTPNTVGAKTYTATKIVLNGFTENLVGPSDSVLVSNAPTYSSSADCEESNPNSDRILTFEVADSGGTFTAVDYDNQGNSLNFNGGGNGDGTSTFTVPLPSSTVIETVLLTYTTSNGCPVSSIQGVPTNCDCPTLDEDVTATEVCVGTGDDIVFEVNSVVAEGVTYTGNQLSVTWYDLANTELSTMNPFNYDTTGMSAGNVQLKYEVDIVSTGCSATGFVTGVILTPQSTSIAMDGTGSGGFNGELCNGNSVGFISTLEGEAYSWKIDGAQVGTNRTYTFSEDDSSSPYELTLEVEDSKGCIATASQTIDVVNCYCTVQYVEINPGNPISNIDTVLHSLVFGDQQQIISNIQPPAACFGENNAASINDAFATEIRNLLLSSGDTANVEVFWQFTDYDPCKTRFYIFNSDLAVVTLKTSSGGEVVEYSLTRDCTSGDAPGCIDNPSDNYNASLNSATGIDIVDPQGDECFSLYYKALFRTAIVDGEGQVGDTLDFDLTYTEGSQTPTTIPISVTTQSGDLISVGSYTYNKTLVDAINAVSTGLVAELPTSADIDNNNASIGSGDCCTGKTEMIVLYWPASDTFFIDDNISCGIATSAHEITPEETLTYKICGTVSNSITIREAPIYKELTETP